MVESPKVAVVILGGVSAPAFVACSFGLPGRRVKRSGSDTWPRRLAASRAATPLDALGDSVQHEAAKLEPNAAMNDPASLPARASVAHGAA
jgi:hypothetical protein